MRAGALTPYEAALAAGTPLTLTDGRGLRIPLDIRRYLAPPDAADRSVLRRCAGSVLDIGSGPGRLVSALSASGHPALGIDIAPGAVAHSLRAGGPAVQASVFDPLPNEGDWGTALLIDGNIGIGGDVPALLRRVLQLVADHGMLVVETTGEPTQHESLSARFDSGSEPAAEEAWFPWAVIGAIALRASAASAGWAPAEEWSLAGRAFTSLTPSAARAHSARASG